ncbi:MAG TPA: hypothetical protein DCE56_07205 [Cyanobacteria bacterium UBA8553]|nr:hypothetical protein [Cyanobacteria bacterium UBA8553]HAJ58884.1 hypothetical protein [Cyanobacteria bacterium UBA8543]
MKRFLEQQLQRRQVFFATTPKLEGKSIHLVVSTRVERETVFDVVINYEKNTPILKGKVFTREQKELIEKVAVESFKNKVRSQLTSFPYDDVEADYGITIQPMSNLYVKPRKAAKNNLATQVRLGTPVKLLEYSPDKKFVGYVQTVFRAGNIELPRDADQQQFYTQPIAPTLQKIDELQPGDLVFFSDNRIDTTHVGIYIGNYQLIHSSRGGAYSGVKISRLKNGDNYDKYLQSIYFGGGRIPKLAN